MRALALAVALATVGLTTEVRADDGPQELDFDSADHMILHAGSADGNHVYVFQLSEGKPYVAYLGQIVDGVRQPLRRLGIRRVAEHDRGVTLKIVDKIVGGKVVYAGGELTIHPRSGDDSVDGATIVRAGAGPGRKLGSESYFIARADRSYMTDAGLRAATEMLTARTSSEAAKKMSAAEIKERTLAYFGSLIGPWLPAKGARPAKRGGQAKAVVSRFRGAAR